MVYDTNHPGSQAASRVKTFKPTLGHLEVQRRRKLERALPDVRAVLDHASAEAREIYRDRVSPLVALIVAEIAVLDRQTDATDSMVMRSYGKIIADALDLHDDPFLALSLWKAGATAPLQTFARRWTEHLARAERDSESRYHHSKLIDLDVVSAALNLTRPRIRDIFGKTKCTLPPKRMIDPSFSVDEHRLIRELAGRTGWSTRRIRDHAIACAFDAEAFTRGMWPVEVNILPEAKLSGHRIDHQSDVQTSRWVKRNAGKPGPKRRSDTITRQIQAVADWRGVNKRTIQRMRKQRTAELLEAFGEDGEVTFSNDDGVPMSPNSCPDVTEFQHSEKVTFAPCSPDSSDGDTRTVKGVLITDLILIDIVDEGWRSGRRTRWSYPEKETVEAWYLATEGKPLSAEMRKKWAQRDLYRGKLETARRWKREIEIRAKEDAAQLDVIWLLKPKSSEAA